jgi:hypothetical protein
MQIDLSTACDRIELFAREGRLTGGEWHNARDGREIACIYGSIDPSISSVNDCPASLGPRWLHELVISLFDGLADDATRNVYGLRYAQALRKTEAWTPERWEGARADFLCLTIDKALSSAKAVAETADYWLAVDAACQQVKRALRGDGDLTAAEAAARTADAAAEAAARTADAAAEAAARTADAAASAAARTASAAACAAACAASAAASAAAEAAYAAARAAASAAARTASAAAEAAYAAARTAYAAARAALFGALIDLLNA